MKTDETAEWAYAGLKGAAAALFANVVGWVEVVGLFKAVTLAVATTVGSYATKKALQHMEPKIKQLINKFKNKKSK